MLTSSELSDGKCAAKEIERSTADNSGPRRIKMKYVRPYALFKQIEKRNVELAQRKAIRAQLLGFNVLDDYVTVAISDTAMERVKHYGHYALVGAD
ncbi:hypothetical protein Dsin_027913 [Dipteronia sinensis]|uniref:Uncharacterized protein n=1 Tax=Dipteronia sinensis TaxID=43782 RepID=A0AAE0DV20_9ROSI|nr:hypothetical protein Dsin_027913 [Dipteronia sinensis]